MKIYAEEEFQECPLRGVTSVLNTIFGNKFENLKIPEYILNAAAERGTAVHKYIEEWLKWYDRPFKKLDEFEPHLGLEYAIYETVWKDWLDDRIEWDIIPLYLEHKIINKRLGMKGIIDCIAKVNGEICLIDWKTSSALDEWTTNCQLQLYYLMLSRGDKDERELAKQIKELRCLSLTKAGYRWFKFKIDKKLSESILKLWKEHFREIAEAEKSKAMKLTNKDKPVII